MVPAHQLFRSYLGFNPLCRIHLVPQASPMLSFIHSLAEKVLHASLFKHHSCINNPIPGGSPSFQLLLGNCTLFECISPLSGERLSYGGSQVLPGFIPTLLLLQHSISKGALHTTRAQFSQPIKKSTHNIQIHNTCHASFKDLCKTLFSFQITRFGLTEHILRPTIMLSLGQKKQ